MRGRGLKIWCLVCCVQFIIIGCFLLVNSRIFNVDRDIVVTARSDYSIQLAKNGMLIDTRQIGNNSIVASNITRYMVKNKRETELPVSLYDVVIMEDGHHTPSQYIIYDTEYDRYIFVNESTPDKAYWVGGLWNIEQVSAYSQKRFRQFIETGEWINL